MSRRKDISTYLREVLAAVHEPVNSISKHWSPYLVRKFIHKWKTFRSAASQECMSQPIPPRLYNSHRNPGAPSQALWGSVSKLTVKVHYSTIRNRENKYELFGSAAGESLQSCIRTTTSPWEQMRPKYTCLSIMHSSITTNTSDHLSAWWRRAEDLGSLQAVSGPWSPLYIRKVF